jgi:hypothetical protein
MCRRYNEEMYVEVAGGKQSIVFMDLTRRGGGEQVPMSWILAFCMYRRF